MLEWVFISALFLARCPHYCVRGSIQGDPHRLSMEDAVRRRPDDRCCVHEGTAGKYKDIEERDGEKGHTCEHGEDKDNGV